MNPIFDMLSRNEEYTIFTEEGDYSGEYVGRETSEGFSFFYLENEEDDYRITLVVREKEGTYFADVNSTSGDHKTLASMVKFESIE